MLDMHATQQAQILYCKQPTLVLELYPSSKFVAQAFPKFFEEGIISDEMQKPIDSNQ